MNIITIKSLMHMHIQTKCVSLIYHLDFDLHGKNKKTPKFGSQIDTDEL